MAFLKQIITISNRERQPSDSCFTRIRRVAAEASASSTKWWRIAVVTSTTSNRRAFRHWSARPPVSRASRSLPGRLTRRTIRRIIRRTSTASINLSGINNFTNWVGSNHLGTVSSVVIQRSCGVFQDESEFVRSADEDDQVRFAVAHGHAVWWRLLRFLPHALLWFSLRKNGVLLYANCLSFIIASLIGIFHHVFDLLFSGFARYQPGATSLEFHFHSDESVGLSGFLISFEQVYNC